MSDPVKSVQAVLSDSEFTETVRFAQDDLGGRFHKVGAAAVLMLEHVNLHKPAEALAEALLRDPEMRRMINQDRAHEIAMQIIEEVEAEMGSRKGLRWEDSMDSETVQDIWNTLFDRVISVLKPGD